MPWRAIPLLGITMPKPKHMRRCENWFDEVAPNEIFVARGTVLRALPHMRLGNADPLAECVGCVGYGSDRVARCFDLPLCSGMTFVQHGEPEGSPADLIQEDNEVGNFPADAFRKWFIVERSDTGARGAGRQVAAALASEFK